MGDQEIFYAKSANAYHDKITNRDHLERVRKLARQFGSEIGMPDEAELAGIFHDFGKYGQLFQELLHGKVHNIDHAFAGAAFLYGVKKLWGKRRLKVWLNYAPILEAIQGHHDGLISLDALSEALESTLSEEKADCCPSGKHPSLSGKNQYQAAMRAFQKDFPDFRLPKIANREVPAADRAADMLDTRMLFSCLVDADYSVSASDDEPDYFQQSSGEKLDAKGALDRLEAYLAEIRKGSTAAPGLNALRNQVYEACGRAGNMPVGLYTLTAPTGVGKTLAMLHFALRQCQENALRRIIVVLPFLSLAEQTEKEYRHVFRDILVDHSQSKLSDEQRDFAARWDAPIIITTSVRFFESLFSDNPGDCRKLHNIAGSVILFDEAQSLPAELAAPTVEAVQALCRKYQCTMVFSTATQPDFGSLPKISWDPVEILPENRHLFEKMRRTQSQWRFSSKYPLEEIGREMAQSRNVCCIVNLRRHARTLFTKLKEETGEEGLFLLTTDLCPAHRLAVVKEIKRRQKAGEICRVVATQCIEAGVDLDFDVMYRTLAPLESIIQAAGRCNRNGRLTNDGQVITFEPEEEGRLYPGDEYGRAAMTVKELWEKEQDLDLNSAETIRAYYHRFFAFSKQNENLEKALAEKSYPDVAKNYRLINSAGIRLIVPWDGEQKMYTAVMDALTKNSVTFSMLRDAAPITITCFEEETVRACATPIGIYHGRERVETGCYILNEGFENCYDPVMGFQAEGKLYENYFG